MGFFKKDKAGLVAQQELQERYQHQQQLLETTQAQLRQAEETISQLQTQLREENRQVHLYRTETARLTSELQSELQDLRTQLEATRGNFNAESHQRQMAENRVQEAELRYSRAVSSLEEQLGGAMILLDQMKREREEHNRVCGMAGRVMNAGIGGGRVLGTDPALVAAPHVISARQSVPSFRSVSMGTQSPAENNVHGNGNRNGRNTAGPQAQAYPARPRSAMNFGNPSYTQHPTAPNHNRTNSTMQHIPESIAELPTGQETHPHSNPMSEEAQHRRAILESAEIARYEERIRTAEASREQMQTQFTSLSGEVATLKKALQEKDRELFVRDNQLEWVQQRAAALMRGDEDSPFLAD
ncbi:hypothetical protein V8F20_001898 [Naviculisporaceae sp. PSN 640]